MEFCSNICRVLKGGVQGEGVFLGKPKDSVWEDWGILGKIRETPPGTLDRILLNLLNMIPRRILQAVLGGFHGKRVTPIP